MCIVDRDDLPVAAKISSVLLEDAVHYIYNRQLDYMFGLFNSSIGEAAYHLDTSVINQTHRAGNKEDKIGLVKNSFLQKKIAGYIFSSYEGKLRVVDGVLGLVCINLYIKAASGSRLVFLLKQTSKSLFLKRSLPMASG